MGSYTVVTAAYPLEVSIETGEMDDGDFEFSGSECSSRVGCPSSRKNAQMFLPDGADTVRTAARKADKQIEVVEAAEEFLGVTQTPPQTPGSNLSLTPTSMNISGERDRVGLQAATT